MEAIFITIKSDLSQNAHYPTDIISNSIYFHQNRSLNLSFASASRYHLCSLVRFHPVFWIFGAILAERSLFLLAGWIEWIFWNTIIDIYITFGESRSPYLSSLHKPLYNDNSSGTARIQIETNVQSAKINNVYFSLYWDLWTISSYNTGTTECKYLV